MRHVLCSYNKAALAHPEREAYPWLATSGHIGRHTGHGCKITAVRKGVNAPMT